MDEGLFEILPLKIVGPGIALTSGWDTHFQFSSWEYSVLFLYVSFVQRYLLKLLNFLFEIRGSINEIFVDLVLEAWLVMEVNILFHPFKIIKSNSWKELKSNSFNPQIFQMRKILPGTFICTIFFFILHGRGLSFVSNPFLNIALLIT